MRSNFKPLDTPKAKQVTHRTGARLFGRNGADLLVEFRDGVTFDKLAALANIFGTKNINVGSETRDGGHCDTCAYSYSVAIVVVVGKADVAFAKVPEPVLNLAKTIALKKHSLDHYSALDGRFNIQAQRVDGKLKGWRIMDKQVDDPFAPKAPNLTEVRNYIARLLLAESRIWRIEVG